MSNSNLLQCPACGWTGKREDAVTFDSALECPICAELLEQASPEADTGDSTPLLCPTCGWTGGRSSLRHVEGDRQCPICEENIEFVE